jgi:hypothetical protein
MTVWNLGEIIAKRRRLDPDAMLAPPARPPGPQRRRRDLPAPDQIAGNGGVRTNTTRSVAGFSPRGDPQGFPLP